MYLIDNIMPIQSLNYFETISLGVFSGVLTSLFIFIVSRFFSDIFVPWYRAKIYNNADLSGNWDIIRGKIASDNRNISVDVNISVSLNQKANELTGTAIATQVESKVVTKYYIKGEIRDRLVLLSFFVDNRQRIAYQSFLLEVVGDGYRMEGYNAFYGIKLKKVRSVDCVFIRSQVG